KAGRKGQKCIFSDPPGSFNEPCAVGMFHVNAKRISDNTKQAETTARKIRDKPKDVGRRGGE
ncbi:MAG TPA: hypothetical protein PK745_15450, partial [bacterium]|nr:hypothetical protein [bacterium]